MQQVYVTTQLSINGDGLYYPSISIYFSGCDKPIKCPNCQNPELQKQGHGFKTNVIGLIKGIEKTVIQWLEIYPNIAITYLGGEALAEWNREATLTVSKYFKDKYKNKIQNTFYTWRYLNDLKEIKAYIQYMDVGVLGDFKEEFKVSNRIPSSTNQIIWDFKNNIQLPNIIKEEN